MASKKVLYLLALLTLVAAALRFIGLTSVPPSLNWDEVSHAYAAWSLLKTGHDQWGQVLPVVNFRAYGDYPAPLNLYFTVPSLALLGPSDFAARFPHALIGTLLIPLVFIATYRLTRNRYLSLAAAFFMCFDPFSFFLSRQVLQANWTVFLLTLILATYPRFAYLPLLSLLAYHNTRIFVPLLVIVLSVLYKKNYLPTLITILAAGLILLMPSSRARSSYVSIINPGTISQIEQLRNRSTFSPLVTSLLYNRPVYFVTHALSNYTDYLLPSFLFFQGGTQYQFSLPHFGVLNLVELPLFYLGLLYLGLTFRRRTSKLLMAWLLLSPIPAAITQDRMAVVRATTMLPVVMIISSVGLVVFLHQRLIPLFLVLFFAWSGYYLYAYFTIYPKHYSQSWQYGYQQLTRFVGNYIFTNHSNNNQILVTKRYGEPHEFFLWYYKWVYPQTVVWDYHDNWYWVNQLDNLHFYNDWETPPDLKQYKLIVSSPDHPLDAGRPYATINFLDGSPAFIISQQ